MTSFRRLPYIVPALAVLAALTACSTSWDDDGPGLGVPRDGYGNPILNDEAKDPPNR